MQRIWRVLAGAFLAATVAILINVVSADLVVPRQYYLIVLAVLIALIIAAAFLDHAGERIPRARNVIRQPGGSGRPPQALEGNRQRRSGLGASLFQVFDVMGGLVSITLGFVFLFGTVKVRPDPLVGAVLLALGVALLVWYALLVLGVRTRLEFSEDGIVLRDVKGAFFIGWDEATNFRTLKPGFLTTYLVADPVPGSSWYTGPWKFDEKNEVIRICDLTELSISPGNVSFALANWDPGR